MARRRKADAPAADAAMIETTDDAVSANPAEQPTVESTSAPPADAEATEAAPRRRRASTRRKPTGDDPTSEAIVEAAPPPETSEIATEGAAETLPLPGTESVEATGSTSLTGANPRRAPRRRNAKAEAPSRDEAAALLAGMTADLPAPLADTPAPDVSTADVPAAEVADGPTEVLPETVLTPEETPAETKPGRSRRRSSRKAQEKAQGEATPTEIIAPPQGSRAVPPVSSPALVPAPATAPTDTKKRLRGQRTPRPAGPTIIAATPPTPTIIAPLVDKAPEDAAADAATEEAATAAPKRTRGLRKAVKPAPPSLIVAPIVALEPVPLAYQPLPDDILARLAETRVVLNKNLPELRVDGEPRLPFWFFVNTEDPETLDVAIAQVRLAYEAGVRFFSVLAHLPWKTRSGERRYQPLDEALQFIADNAPDAFILPRLLFAAPNSWIRAHEDEMTLYPDNEVGDVSLASKAFWEEEADAALRAAVERVAQGPHAGRVFGFYLEHGEWFYEKGRGHDRSEANIKGFQEWLRERYRNNQVALRASWFDGAVTFDSADVPDWPPAEENYFFLSARERRYADYHEYASDLVAQVITRLGKAVKEASGNRSAVAVSYGYALELMRPGSGHLSLASVLESPFVDILTGPVSYTARTPGGSAALPAPLDSVRLAGKLWVSEDDTKTHLSLNDTPDTYNPKIATLEGTWAAHSRNFGAALAKGAGVSFMDLWGQGWLADRAVWQNIARLKQIGERVAEQRRASESPAPEPDVAVFVDERSFFGVRADDGLLDELIAQHRDTLLRSGARVGFYLLSDLLKENFPKTPRLFLFLNAFRLTDEIRIAIRTRFQNDGRTLAWVYGPGALEESVTEIADTVGMTLQLQPWGSRTGTQISSSVRSPLSDALRGQKIGDEARLNPSFYVADPRAQVLGEYVHTGCASLAVRKHARWQSVFIGERSLPLPLLRGLYRLAGVPVYTVDDDVALVGDSFLLLHSAPGGGTTVFLPSDGALGDALTGESFAADGFGARLSLPPQGTRLLVFGSTETLAKFGVDARYAPHGLTESELPPPMPPFVFETPDEIPAPQIPSDADPEDVALFDAALDSDFTIADKENDEDEEATESGEALAAVAPGAADSEAAKKKRRRRRRRGRGKGPETDETEEIGEGDEEIISDFDEDSEPSLTVESAEPMETPALTEPPPTETPVTALPPVRMRPSLEELLPLSDALIDSADDSDLLSIPDEFLPLDSKNLLNPAAEEPTQGVAETRRPVRRTRRRPAATTEAKEE